MASQTLAVCAARRDEAPGLPKADTHRPGAQERDQVRAYAPIRQPAPQHVGQGGGASSAVPPQDFTLQHRHPAEAFRLPLLVVLTWPEAVPALSVSVKSPFSAQAQAALTPQQRQAILQLRGPFLAALEAAAAKRRSLHAELYPKDVPVGGGDGYQAATAVSSPAAHCAILCGWCPLACSTCIGQAWTLCLGGLAGRAASHLLL